MGHVINIDNNRGELPSVLTETGAGGVLSAGYLRESPAREYLRPDEVPVFALTNGKRGVERTRNGERRALLPGSDYRTIAVLTDQRLVVLVGDCDEADGGDARFTVDLIDVQSVSTERTRRVGQITLVHGDDRSTTVYCGRRGLSEAAEYVRAASQAWIHVANELDAIAETIDEVTAHLEADAHDEAVAAARAAGERLDDPRGTARAFAEEWGGVAMTERVAAVERRCAETLADARRQRARAFVDEAESRWRDDAYEAARDAYDRARAEYEAVLSVGEAVTDTEAVRGELDRLDRAVDRLAETPLRRAAAASRAATAAEDEVTAADRWETALDHYRTALELDWGADERRFDGTPAAIRERLGDVVERAVSARRAAATAARDAGDWCVGAEQFDVALEEFETAREQYSQALALARDRYPDAVDHLSVERDAVEERIERARAARDGDGPEVRSSDGSDADVRYDVDAAIGTERDGTGTSESEGAPVSADGEPDPADERVDAGIEERLRRLDEAAFVDVVETVLAETGWTTHRPPDGEPYAIRATKETPIEERMYVTIEHRPGGSPLDQTDVEECATLGGDGAPDSVMLATSAGVTDQATRHARRQQVHVLDDEYISTVIEAREMEHVLDERRVEVE